MMTGILRNISGSILGKILKMMTKILRRQLWVGLLMAGMIFLGFGVGQATAKQANMTAARSSLTSAKVSLEKATANKGGHRVKAIKLIKQAIIEVNAGIKKAEN